MYAPLLHEIQPYSSEFDYADSELTWHRVLQQILRYQVLSPNWDGEESETPTGELIESLLEYLLFLKDEKNLPAPARTMVTEEGGIIVEWQDTHGVVELECEEPWVGELMFAPDDGDTTFLTIDWQPTDVSEDYQLDFNDIYSSTTTIEPFHIFSAA